MAGIQHFYAYNHYTKLSVKNQQGFSLFHHFCAIANDAKYLGVPWRAEWIQCSDNFIQFSEKLITLSVGNIMAAEFHFLKQFSAAFKTASKRLINAAEEIQGKFSCSRNAPLFLGQCQNQFEYLTCTERRLTGFQILKYI